jgi:predicted RNase H-like HicB family nuclease
MKTTTYLVTLEQDEAGWWVGSLPAVPGCHTQGRSVHTVLRRLHEAIAAAGEDSGDLLIGKVHLRVAKRGELAKLCKQVQARRRRAEQAEVEYQEAQRLAASRLTKTMSVRDAAALLGLSHQRVQQLARRGRRAGWLPG